MRLFFIIIIAVCTGLCSEASREYKSNNSKRNKLILALSLIFTLAIIVIYAFGFATR